MAKEGIEVIQANNHRVAAAKKAVAWTAQNLQAANVALKAARKTVEAAQKTHVEATYIPSPLDRAVRHKRDKPAENTLSAEIHDFIIDDLACWRQSDGEDDHRGEFSFRCEGVRAYDIGLALVGIDYSIDCFCV